MNVFNTLNVVQTFYNNMQGYFTKSLQKIAVIFQTINIILKEFPFFPNKHLSNCLGPSERLQKFHL